MISIFKRLFDSIQSGPVDFNVVTGEWSFKQHKESPEMKHHQADSQQNKARRVVIAFLMFLGLLMALAFWAAFNHSTP
ncbi:MAG TPA: hypothetical protein VG759_07925 [Candidatus Angelobacter sp.]|jgi:hypothetical protein|nr:hypothetical protein [Candidatus Angelobacter sp.]